MLVPLAVAGCDAGTPDPWDESRGGPLQPVRVLAVTATTGHRFLSGFAPFEGEPVGTAEQLVEGTTLAGVALHGTLAIHFDRLLDPASVARQAVCVRADTTAVEKLEDCTQPTQEFLAVDYDPVTRRVLFRGATFEPATLYKVTAFVAGPPSNYGFRGFDGAPLDRHYEFLFETEGDSPSPPAEPLRTAERYCAAIRCTDHCLSQEPLPEAAAACVANSCPVRAEQNPLQGRCAKLGCHLNAADSPPAEGLSFGSPADLVATAIGRAAHETASGGGADEATQTGQPFGRAMPIIEPRAPGNSYAIYKALINPLNHCGLRSDCSSDVDVALRVEIARARAAFVMGAPMPASADDPATLPPSAIATPPLLDVVASGAGPAIVYDGLRTISDWVAHGAPICRCNTAGCVPDPDLTP